MSFMDKFYDSKTWTAKYRPSKVSDLILPDRIKNTLEHFVKNNEVSNLLLAGPAGCGKTSTAVAIVEELDLDVLYINGSKETSIDVIRSRVQPFVTTMSPFGRKKIVICDECLEENESIRVGTVDDWKPVKMKNLPKEQYFPIVSFNMDTKTMENDQGIVHVEREAEVFEVELEDGRTISVTDNHPFMVLAKDGTVIEKSLKDGLSEGDDIITV